MTALYAIAAVIVIAGIMTGAYLIGFGDGITAEQMRKKNAAALPIMEETPTSTNHHDGEDYPQQEQRHQLTSADLAQLEQEAKSK
jgi:hypothetical protein